MAGNNHDGENEKKNINDAENESKPTSGGSNGKKHVGVDPTSPFYLHPSDHPGMNICPVILKGDNYPEWESSMRNAFRAKRKLGFLNGTVTQPNADASEIEDWWSVNSMLVGWIIQSIESSLRSTITYYDTVKELWDDIHQRFSITNGPRILQLRSDLARCNQNGQSIAAYYGHLKKIWDELSTYITNRTCTCGKCTCKWAADLSKERQDEQVHQFLMGLDDEMYGTLRSNIIAQDPLPSLNRVYALAVQEERHKHMTKGRDARTEAVAFAVHGGSSYSGTKASDKSNCSNCGKPNHDVSSCFKIIGYPEWWNNGRGSSKGNGRGKGTDSGTSRGRGKAPVAFANAAQFAPNSVTTQPVLTHHDRNAVGPTLTDDQWGTILNMFKNLNNNNNNTSNEKLTGKSFSPWILDTGASYHMTGDKRLFQNLSNIFPSPVVLPDGTHTNAVQEGTIVLGENMTINRVLYVPRLTCNLISFSQLIKDLNCVVTLTDKLCVIQDRTSRMVIGVGEERDGVYWFRSVVPNTHLCHAAEVDSYQVWHRRLGHPSPQIIGLLPLVNISDCRKNKDEPCDICFKAKQTRVSFPISSSNKIELFELIHCDVWGPYSVSSSCGASYFLTIVDDCSRGVWIYLMANKTEVANLIKNFCAMTQTQFGKKVKCIRSDNGTEFTSLQHYLAEHGILFETSCVGTPQQNGRVERKHRHILNVARALRFQANLPIEFWGECVLTAGYLINRTPTPILKGKTPYEVIFGHTPIYNHIKTFGCLCFASKIPRDRNKFAARSRKCIFVGYPHGKKGWRLYDIETRDFFISRDVVFL
jgi:hypothetical protein